MLASDDRLLLFWDTRAKRIPHRPRHPEAFPLDDERHWHDVEYAGWGITKVNIPDSPGDGPRGKRVVYLQAGEHPYHVAFAEGLSWVAERSGIRLLTLSGNMTMAGQDVQVRRAIAERPDMVILVPINCDASIRWAREINEAGIPVIAANSLPNNDETYRYILSWCGPDDWGQFRMLSRKFAQFMGFKGGYAIVRHFPGASCYNARTYSVITELRKVAPHMRCLAMAPSGDEGECDMEKTMNLVLGWIGEFGAELKGIVSPDDSAWLDGINEAIRRTGRADIVRVGAGSSQKGMQLVKEGRCHAITFQSAQADGALPMKIAVDWFNGLEIQPINYLPKFIITRDNVDDFLMKKPEFSSVSLDTLTRAVLAASESDVDRFFEDAYQSFLASEMMTPDFFRGFCIEVLSTLIHIVKMNDLDERLLFSDYENLYKNLFNQKTPKNAMEWMKRISRTVIHAISQEWQSESQADRIVKYVERNYASPLSLKVLSCQFDISAPYLGRLFHQATGKSFATYLNELRLRRAEELLRYTNLKATEVAARIGYVNANYFYTLFKKYKGYYPSESKKRI